MMVRTPRPSSPSIAAEAPRYSISADALARSPKAFSPPRSGFYPQIGNELTNVFQEVNTGSKTPEQSLKDAQARLDVLWQTYVAQVKPK